MSREFPLSWFWRGYWLTAGCGATALVNVWSNGGTSHRRPFVPGVYDWLLCDSRMCAMS